MTRQNVRKWRQFYRVVHDQNTFVVHSQARSVRSQDVIGSSHRSGKLAAQGIGKLIVPADGLRMFVTAGQLLPEHRVRLARAMELHRQGRIAEAEPLYRQILSAAPNCIDALHFCGLAATQRGALDEGIALLRRAVGLHPAAAAIQCNLARALIQQRDARAAISSCDAAIASDPANADAWFIRGNALQVIDAHQQAVADYDQAVRLVPGFAAALNKKGHSQRMLRQTERALATFERALVCRPDYAMAFNNRGLALLDLDRAGEAVTSFDAALSLQPTLAEAVGNRGTALLALKRFAEAAAAFKQLDAMAPGFDAAAGSLLHARRNCCDWADGEALRERVIDGVRLGRVADAPLSFLYTSDSPPEQLQCASAFVRARYPARAAPGTPSVSTDGRRIRVAYLSGDFGEHAVSHLLAAVLEHHDVTRVETVGIGWGRRNDGSMRRRIEAAFTRFVDATNLSDAQVAALLRESNIDIAVDLMGHTHGQRTGVFALRGAPLQVAYLGFPGTTGAPYMDYVIGDSVVIPAGEDAAYSERVVRLPHCCLPTDDRRSIAAEPPTRAAAGLPPTGFVFCAFNNAAKITRDLFAVWMRLLQAVPGSVLWLRTPGEDARGNLQREARQLGIEPQRLVFADAVPMEEHLARQRLADLFLDTLPYNAHATACDALWAGLPVLTCRGKSFAGRVGASLLLALGLVELVAESIEDYQARALEFARHPGRLAALKAKLAACRTGSPLFDTGLYTRHLEAAYAGMIRRRCHGLAAADLTIEAGGEIATAGREVLDAHPAPPAAR